MRTKRIQTIAIALAVSAMIAGCNPPMTAETSNPAAPSYTTDTVKRQDITGYSFVDGKLVIPTTAQASAFSPYDTPVESVSVITGKYVRRGQPIIKLTIPGVDEAKSMAKADAASAKSNLSTAKTSASAPVDQAKQELADAQAAEKRARDTVASGGSADVDAAVQARVQAEENLRQAQQQLNETVQPQKEALAQSNAELQSVREDARKGIVRAPISGTVVTLGAKPGTQATANTPLATIIDFEAARVQATIPADLKDDATYGAHVAIFMSGASSAPVDGIVDKVTVAPPVSGQASSGYVAEIRFANPRQMLQPSTSVNRIGVKTGSVENALVVPVGAVVQKNGQAVVMVKNGEQWVETPVATGLTDGVVMEIRSGLSEGQEVQVAQSAAVSPPQG